MGHIYLMTVDLGTSFIKVGVYDGQGQCCALTQSPIQSDKSKPGIFLQSGEEILRAVIAGMKRASGMMGPDSDKIAAVGFTGQMAGFIGVDDGWNDITGWSCSLDTRYIPYSEAQMEELRDEFLQISGTNAPLMASKCKWFVTEFPKQAEKIAKYMVISSYIIGKLGKANIEDAVIDGSYITWTGLADVGNRVWSDTLCRKSGIFKKRLPDIVSSNEICGYLDGEIANKTGLKTGIPLVAGAGDKMAGCVGSGILNVGDMIFEASSYGAVSCLVNEFRPNMRTRDYDAIPSFSGENYYIHKYLPGSGITLKWYLDTFMEENPDWKTAFSIIEKAAERIPCGSEGLMAVGLLGGSAMPFDGALKGAWIGHTWSHKKEHFYRALLESYAYELALTIDSMKEMYPDILDIKQILMIGGGAGSLIWPQILADVIGCEFVLPDREDAALWGTAVLAGNAIGMFHNMAETIEKTVGVKQHVSSDYVHHKKYQELKQCYFEMKEMVHEMCIKLR